MIKKCFFLLVMAGVFLTGCKGEQQAEVASFEVSDLANKVSLLLSKMDIVSNVVNEKEIYKVYVSQEDERNARLLLTKYNFYFEPEDLNELLQTKFASLSKLEEIKGNLLQGREIYNKLSIIPGVLRASVIVSGGNTKQVSVLIMSINEIDQYNKDNIEGFVRGVLSEEDMLKVSYFVPEYEFSE